MTRYFMSIPEAVRLVLQGAHGDWHAALDLLEAAERQEGLVADCARYDRLRPSHAVESARAAP